MRDSAMRSRHTPWSTCLIDPLATAVLQRLLRLLIEFGKPLSARSDRPGQHRKTVVRASPGIRLQAGWTGTANFGVQRQLEQHSNGGAADLNQRPRRAFAQAQKVRSTAMCRSKAKAQARCVLSIPARRTRAGRQRCGSAAPEGLLMACPWPHASALRRRCASGCWDG